MSEQHYETVDDILREMREYADTDSQVIGRDVLRRDIQHFADRIEAAYKHELEDCALRVAPIVRAETIAECKRGTAHKREMCVANNGDTDELVDLLKGYRAGYRNECPDEIFQRLKP